MSHRRTCFGRSFLLAPLVGCACLSAARDEPPADAAPVPLPIYVVEGVRERPEAVLLGNGTAEAAPVSLTAALAGAPGLVLLDGGEGIYPPRIMVRGSGLQSAPASRGLVLRVDSLPLNAADGSFNLALLEPAFFAAYTFQPGGADPAAAGLALGGVLDFSWWTDSGVRLVAGSDGLFRADVREAETSGSRSWAGALAFTRSDGRRRNSEQERFAAAARAEWSTLGGFTQALSFYAVRADLRIPGPLTLAAAETAPDTISAMAAADLPRRTTDYARVVYRAAWKDEFEAALGVQATDDNFRQLRANGIAVTRGSDVLGRVSGRWYLARELTVEAGASGSYGERTQQRFANLAGVRGARFADLRLHAGTATGWLDAAWKPTACVTLTGSVSALAVRRAASGTASASGAMNATALAPHVELAASPSARRLVEAFVRAERGTEAPTFDDLLAVRGTAPSLALGWAPLRLQTADTFSVGLRGRFGQPVTGADRLSFEITAYTADWRHELLRLANADGVPRGTVNAGATRHRGIESRLSWRLLAGPRTLDLVAAHTLSEARFAGDPVYGDNRLAGLPPHVGSVQLRCAAEAGWFAEAGAKWAWDTTYADHGDRLGYGGYTVFDATLGWRARRWSVVLGVGNLFDRRPVASTAGVLDLARNPAATAVFLPGAPRMFTGTFEWRW